jgi:hypothetical protein
VKQQAKQVVKLTREDKALQLFQAGAVSKISDDLYHVKSQKNLSVEYEIIHQLMSARALTLREMAYHASMSLQSRYIVQAN